MVRPDGTFVIRATLRSFFSDDGDLELAARGRYAVASVEGGNATVYGIAGQDTHVALAQPRFVLRRKSGGHLLHFSIRIPGADEHVRVAIKLGGTTLASGYSTRSGTFSKTILQACGARQPPCRRLRARRGHGDLEGHSAQPVGTGFKAKADALVLGVRSAHRAPDPQARRSGALVCADVGRGRRRQRRADEIMRQPERGSLRCAQVLGGDVAVGRECRRCGRDARGVVIRERLP